MGKKKDKKFIRQRAKRGFADQDVWSIDYWFIDVMSKMLTQLKNTQHGVPVMQDDDGNIMSMEDASKKWQEALDKMIFLLHEMNEETCSFQNPYDDDLISVYSIRYSHHPSELPEYKDTVDKYLNKEKEIANYRNECKDEFFVLFSKYFWNLWD